MTGKCALYDAWDVNKHHDMLAFELRGTVMGGTAH